MTNAEGARRDAEPGTGDRYWKGVAVGVAAVIVIVALVAAAGFLMMGRCPMCGRMMQDGMMQGGMMQNDAAENESD